MALVEKRGVREREKEKRGGGGAGTAPLSIYHSESVIITCHKHCSENFP